jgi:TonB family protein
MVVHSLAVLALLGLGTASQELRPGARSHNLVFTEMAPVARPAAARQAMAIPKPALPADAPVRSVLALPRFAAPREARPIMALEAPVPPPLPEPAKIALLEATPPVFRPVAPRKPDVQLGSFSDSAVERPAPARVPGVTEAFAGATKPADQTTRNAVVTGGFGEVATLRGERQGSATTAGAGFGNAASERPTSAEPRQVRAGGFQSAMAIEAPKAAGKAADEAGFASAITILDKPRPSYTEEARQLKIEGEVSLEVLFAANGTARVLRVVKGLGHGLDESAKRSAEAIRFRPAMRGGTPVDAIAMARITFQLAY